MAYTTPKTNWQASDVVQPADMNRIEQNTVELKKAATIDVADANGYFTSSPKNVENVLQELGNAVTSGKTKIATAITAMGQSAASTDTYDTLSSKIRAISTDATAGTGDVLSGKTFYQGGSKKTGAMANNGAVVITPSTQNQTIPVGYHNGAGYVKGDANLVAANIVTGRSIFGIAGSYPAHRLLYLAGTNFINFDWYVISGYPQFLNNGTMGMQIVTDTNGEEGAIVTSSPIDLTYYHTVAVIGPLPTVSVNNGGWIIASTNKTGGYNTYDARAGLGFRNDKCISTLDVSSLTGNYYLRINVNNNSSQSTTIGCDIYAIVLY